jgi:hypothetical protein
VAIEAGGQPIVQLLAGIVERRVADDDAGFGRGLDRVGEFVGTGDAGRQLTLTGPIRDGVACLETTLQVEPA